MEIERFSISTYLRDEDACHVARKGLSTRWPDRAHDHDYYEVFLVEKGQADHWINGRQEKLVPGHLVFIRPSDAHAFRADPAKGFQIINVMLRHETVAHLGDRYPQEFAGRFFDIEGAFPDMHLLQGLRMERGLRAAQRIALSRPSLARLEEFLLTLANRIVTSLAPRGQKMPPWLADACEAARDPNVFRLGAPGFIAVAGRSHEHVCRTCKSVLGVTPSAFVNRMRTEHAADCLARTDEPIADIAARCGIENVSHFYRMFRAQYGTTPRAYRLHHQRAPF